MERERIVDGIVLAAGRSTRMGEPKPLLEVEGESFLERAIRTLREGGCRYIVAVVNEQADWTQRLADVTGAAVVTNDDPDSEQVDSLRLALDAVPEDAAAIAVLPVDFPRVSAATVRAVVGAYRSGGEAGPAAAAPHAAGETDAATNAAGEASRRGAGGTASRAGGGAASIVLPAHEGEAGHPVLLDRSLFDELRTAELPEGVRSLIAAHAAEVRTVPVDDPGVLADVDTPADYRRHVENA
jgi:molybdenum cofactor cytidylyltransferase